MGDVINFVNPFSSKFLGMGGKQSTQSSQSLSQGAFAQFPDLQKSIAQAGWQNIENISPTLQNRLNLGANFQLPGGTSPAGGFEQGLNLASGRAAEPFNFPQVNAMGLYPQQQQAFSTAVQQALGSTSADYANRGFLRPENINAIAGSAAQNVLPQFASMIGQNVQAAALIPEQVIQSRLANLQQQAQGGLTAVLSPEQVTQNRINQLLQLVGLYPGLLGSIGTQVSSGQTNFPGFMQNIGTRIAGGNSVSPGSFGFS